MPFNLFNLHSLVTPSAQYGGGPGWGGHMMYGWGGWLGGPFMIIIWILLIVAGVALIKWLFAASKKDQAPPFSLPAPGHDRSLAILRERYAKGEISSQEFQAMKAELEA
ncbi:MAG: SHOCT domain-containing protein [Desulfarculus sp.]|nr:SHOCT domain-containing protein [Desulfarculus sp.]MBV1737444.1 SHOCT domain-containing protein [Desulfarculus sp.]MBV1753799.1 SHOCT domain-containing protein [Desulfarculus sp.]